MEINGNICSLKRQLDCGFELVLTPYDAKFITLCLVVRHGSKRESKFPGVAHFLEHMLLEFDVHNNISLRGETNYDYTAFIIEGKKEIFDFLLENILIIATGKSLNKKNIENVRADIIDEYISTTKRCVYKLYKDVLHEYNIRSYLPIGKLENINKITYDDIVCFFNDGYKSNNLSLIVMGAPETYYEKINYTLCHNMYKINVKNRRRDLKIDYINNISKKIPVKSQEYIFVFYKMDFIKHSKFNECIETLETIALSLIEEVYVEVFGINSENIFCSIWDVNNVRLLKIVMNNIKHYTFNDIFQILDNKLLFANYISDLLIKKMIYNYDIFFKKGTINSFQYMNYLISCVANQKRICNNADFLRQLHSLSYSDIKKYIDMIVNNCERKIYISYI